MFSTGFPFAETGGQQKDEEYRPPLKGVTPHGVGRCPKGRGDRSVRGGRRSRSEGSFCETFQYKWKPLSQCCALPAPLSGEPIYSSSFCYVKSADTARPPNVSRETFFVISTLFPVLGYPAFCRRFQLCRICENIPTKSKNRTPVSLTCDFVWIFLFLGHCAAEDESSWVSSEIRYH